MSPRFISVLFALITVPFTSHAAQPEPGSGPLSADVSVRPPVYESAFTGYRRYADEKLAGWREVNEEVGRVGGHIGIFGGGGHAGHSASSKPAVNAPPAGQKPQPASPIHGKGHEGMMK